MSVSLTSVSFVTADGRSILHDFTAHFAAERVGVVGANGVGKTTLLRVIAGALSPTRGARQVLGSVAWLDQDLASLRGRTVAEALGVGEALARLARIERGEGSADDFDEADWSLPERMELALRGVELALAPECPVATLSGGQRTRLALARVQIAQPDVLLLDEPTNHLDRAGRAAVAELLAAHRGCAVVVSHDRELLQHVDAIVEMSSLGVQRYGGNYALYTERKSLELSAAQHELEGATKRLEQVKDRTQQALERKARRDGRGRASALSGGAPKILLGARKDRSEDSGGTRARVAERRREQAEHELTAARAKVEQKTSWSVQIASSSSASGRLVLELDDVTVGYGDGPPQLSAVRLHLRGGERLALEGANGSGKSTLLRAIEGTLPLRRGRLVRSERWALLDQQQALLDPALSVRDNYLRRHPQAGEQGCRTALARFLFRGDAALRQLSELSYGERVRAALACVLGAPTPPELLLLDEPTNHLDLDSITTIESALRSYDGALLVASHDRTFLRALGVNRWLTVEAGGLREGGDPDAPAPDEEALSLD